MSKLRLSGIFLLYVVMAALLPEIFCSRILIFPMDLSPNTQFNNMVDLAIILAENKHEVTFLTNARCIPKKEMPENFTLITYTLPEHVAMRLNKTKDLAGDLRHGSETANQFCESLLKRKYILMQLKYDEFELILTDCSNFCARVLIDYLRLPTILWCNNCFEIDDGSFSGSLSRDLAITNEANLLSRLKFAVNEIFYNSIYLPKFVFSEIDEIKRHYGYNTTLSVMDVYSRSKPLVLLNADFSYDLPMPVMPHVIPVAGILFKDPASIPDDVEEWINGSGQHGAIIVDFASISDLIDHTRSIVLARLLAKIPHRVIWKSPALRHTSLPPNARYFSSLSDNDVIAHPKIRLLITDCGDAAMNAAFRYAVPILGIPFFSKRWHHCARMLKRHGVGKVLDITSTSDDEIEAVVGQLLDREAYKWNSIKLAKIVNDQPIPPKEKFLFWVDYVIRHEGVSHLHNGLTYDLSWYEFHMLDVIVVLLISFIFVAFLSILIIYYSVKSLLSQIFYSNDKKLKYH